MKTHYYAGSDNLKNDHAFWKSEVREIYRLIGLDNQPYKIDFLGMGLTVLPNVFSPKYFNNTKWYAERLRTIVGGSRLLEVGTGTGAIALACSVNKAEVVATDINPDACECARINFRAAGRAIPVFQGDVFDPLPKGMKFAL